MAQCEMCGNSYHKTFTIIHNGAGHIFDSFECAIQALAPTCSHCRCKIIGHGLEAGDGALFCCAHCAREMGVSTLTDNAGTR